MKLASFRRIIVEDYPEQYRDMISKLAYSVNTFADSITSAFTNNITLTDNLIAQQKTISITVDGTGTPTNGGTVVTGINGQCGGISVIRAVNATTGTSYPTNTPFISFNNNTSNGTIIINNVTGLKPNNSYSLTLIFWPTS